MCELILMITLYNKSSIEDVYSASSDWVATESYFVLNASPDLLKQGKKDVQKLSESLLLYSKYEQDKDWQNMYLKAMEYNSYYGQVFSYYPTDFSEYYINSDRLEQIRAKYNFPSIKSYGEILDPYANAAEMFSWPLHELTYFTELYEKNLVPMTYSHVDSTTVFLQILRNILVYATPILIILLFYNDRKEYHDMGIDKTMMVIPKARNRFIFGKVVANSLIIMMIIFGPILCFTLVVGIFDHFQNLSYPLFANKAGISSIHYSFFPNLYNLGTLQESIESGIMTNFGLTYTSINMLFNPYMDFIPLWQGILLTLILYIALIFLYVQINMFITRLIKNPNLALTINIALILALIFISPLTSMEFINSFNPLTYRDPGMNVMGTSYYPWSLGMLVIFSYNIILYLGNRIVFAKKYYG